MSETTVGDVVGISPAKLRALANWAEGLADALAITHQDPECRWRATAHARERVRELRALADQLDQRTEKSHTSEAFTELCPAETGYNLRHHTTVAQHICGEGCLCQPERVAHAAPEPQP